MSGLFIVACHNRSCKAATRISTSCIIPASVAVRMFCSSLRAVSGPNQASNSTRFQTKSHLHYVSRERKHAESSAIWQGAKDAKQKTASLLRLSNLTICNGPPLYFTLKCDNVMCSVKLLWVIIKRHRQNKPIPPAGNVDLPSSYNKPWRWAPDVFMSNCSSSLVPCFAVLTLKAV